MRWAGVLAGLTLAATAQAGGFVNGGFEDGTASGWTIGGGSRNGQNLSSMNPNDYLPSGARYDASIATTHSQVVSAGPQPVANGVSIANRVYSGNYSLRVEDLTSGGYVSVASQRVNNYTDANIFFAWLAVLENGGHSAEQSAGMIITLNDLTVGGAPLINRVYNAAGTGGGVDARFSQTGNFFYTPTWQIEQLAIDASLQGHDFLLTVLATDCGPAGHEGYVFLDGFGAIAPPPVIGGDVPEPATALLFAPALLGLAGLRRRRAA